MSRIVSLRANGETAGDAEITLVDGSGARALVAIAIVDPAAFACAYADTRARGDCPLVLNPHLPERTLVEVARHAGARALLTAAEGQAPRSVELARTGPVAPTAGHLLCTSGTTGTPKIYFFDSESAGGNARAHLASIGVDCEGERILLPMSISHGFGLVAGLHAATENKGTLVAFAGVPDPSTLAAALAEHDVSTLYLTPTLARLLLRALARRQTLPALQALRRVSIGSAPMTRGELRALMRFWPEVAFYFTYGLTEMGPRVSTFAAGTDSAPNPRLDDEPARALPIGRAIDGVVCTLTSGDDARLAVASPYAARGRWVGGVEGALEPLPLGAAGFVTEDAAFAIDTGEIEVRGRADGAIVSGGLNIYPEDLERVVLAVPGVAAACVVARSSPLLGEVPVLVCERDATAERIEPSTLERAIAKRIADLLPTTHAPKEIHFVDALPKTALGKVVRREVVAWIARKTS